jgi:hydrogenase large subunit
MATVIAIDPVTRLEGHLAIEVAVDGGVVTEAYATGTLFRGFEAILTNRDPWDAPHITQRICGVCPVPHGQAAVAALDRAANKTIPNNARLLRNLVLGANFVQSHLLHFYHLAALDYIAGPAMAPWQPQWAVDQRVDATTTGTLVSHYVAALDMTRKANEMGAIFGGRMPLPPTYIPGGFTTAPTAAQITKFKAYCAELLAFIKNTYIPDVELLSKVYSDYFQIGGGYGNLIAFGVFELNTAGSSKLLKSGRIRAGSNTVETMNPTAISEQVTHSWYNDATNNLNPANGSTVPQYPKTNAYSWLKSPRYTNEPYEAGALARMKINGDYPYGVSVMDRHRARAYEAQKIALALSDWAGQLVVGQSAYSRYTTPKTATAYGLTEAPRGALGHWVQIANGKIARYQIITPTCWNASPADQNGKHGPIEQALVGTPVSDVKQPIEVLRVIHSFDPCLSCAVHVMKASPHATISTYVPETPAAAVAAR